MASQVIDFKSLQSAYYNGSSLSKIIVNGARVWEKIITQETYTVSVPYTRLVDGPRVKTGDEKKGVGPDYYMPIRQANAPLGSIIYHTYLGRYIYLSKVNMPDLQKCMYESQCNILYYETEVSKVQETYYVNETKTRDVISYVYGP